MKNDVDFVLETTKKVIRTIEKELDAYPNSGWGTGQYVNLSLNILCLLVKSSITSVANTVDIDANKLAKKMTDKILNEVRENRNYFND